MLFLQIWWCVEELLSLGCAQVLETVKCKLSHNLVTLFRLQPHIGIIESLDHGHRDIQHHIGKEHGGHHKHKNKQSLIVLILKGRLRLSDGDIEDIPQLGGPSMVSLEQGIEGCGKGNDEAEEEDEEEAHFIDHVEDHQHKMAYIPEYPQEVEHFDPKEERGKCIDRPLQIE
jgi:hypothetical protein